MSEVGHVGDLGQGLEDAPGEELVDGAAPALGAGHHHPAQGDTPRQPGQHLVHAGLEGAPGREHVLVVPSQVGDSEDAFPSNCKGH